MAEKNEAGQIALKYYQASQVLVRNTPSGSDYVFIPKAAISLAWINQEDVEEVLARYKTCCGGHRKKSFLEANEQDVRIWTNGGGR